MGTLYLSQFVEVAVIFLLMEAQSARLPASTDNYIGIYEFAEAKPTIQSSIGKLRGIPLVSQLANDARFQQNMSQGALCSQTKSEKNPWWIVDLQGEFVVDNVNIYTRTDCCGQDSLPLRVELSTDKQNWTICGEVGFNASATSGVYNVTCAIKRPAGYVKISNSRVENSILTLCEVKVNGGYYLISQNKKTNQSSAFVQAESGLGLIGNLVVDGVPTGACFRSKVEQNPWLEVNLQGVYRVYSVSLMNRRDCCGEKMTPLRIETSLDGKEWSLCADVTDFIPIGGSYQLWCNGEKSTFIRFTNLRREKTDLSLCEVKVHGVPITQWDLSNNSSSKKTLTKPLLIDAMNIALRRMAEMEDTGSTTKAEKQSSTKRASTFLQLFPTTITPSWDDEERLYPARRRTREPPSSTVGGLPPLQTTESIAANKQTLGLKTPETLLMKFRPTSIFHYPRPTTTQREPSPSTTKTPPPPRATTKKRGEVTTSTPKRITPPCDDEESLYPGRRRTREPPSSTVAELLPPQTTESTAANRQTLGRKTPETLPKKFRPTPNFRYPRPTTTPRKPSSSTTKVPPPPRATTKKVVELEPKPTTPTANCTKGKNATNVSPEQPRSNSGTVLNLGQLLDSHIEKGGAYDILMSLKMHLHGGGSSMEEEKNHHEKQAAKKVEKVDGEEKDDDDDDENENKDDEEEEEQDEEDEEEEEEKDEENEEEEDEDEEDEKRNLRRKHGFFYRHRFHHRPTGHKCSNRWAVNLGAIHTIHHIHVYAAAQRHVAALVVSVSKDGELWKTCKVARNKIRRNKQVTVMSCDGFAGRHVKISRPNAIEGSSTPCDVGILGVDID